MELKKFLEHKAKIKQSLQANLLKDKKAYSRGGKSFRKDSLKLCLDFITISADSKTLVKDIQQLNSLIGGTRLTDIEVKAEAQTKYEHCSTVFVGTKYTVSWYELRDEIEDKQVEAHMKNYVKKMIERDIKKIYNHTPYGIFLECKVMKLYKEGKIKWEDVVRLHKEECAL